MGSRKSVRDRRPVAMQPRKRVAIVGSGCSGLGALWALKSTEHEVHLFETADRIGGHTNTVPFEHHGRTANVDTGFIVLNSATYPNFIRFLDQVGVAKVDTAMTFGISRDQGLFEWAGTSLSGLFAQRKNLIDPSFWRMIFDILRFNQFALDLLSDAPDGDIDSDASAKSNPYVVGSSQESIGQYLEREGYSESFKNDYLIPMTACVWSTSPDKCSLDFPAITLVRFLWNHHLLSTVGARPAWMTIKDGSHRYIEAILKDVPPERIHLRKGAKSVRGKVDGKVQVFLDDGGMEAFDHVILATHGDTAAGIIKDSATAEELSIMSRFKTSSNVAVLHSDTSLMPKNHDVWSAWNYITTSPEPGKSPDTVCLTYWMNLLQHIPTDTFGDVLVTLNPLSWPKDDTIQGVWKYRHPLYTSEAVRSQSLLPRIQNTRGISYCGAWTKYGFHEDGFSSGLKVAVDHLGATLPFEFTDSTFSRGRRPQLTLRDHAVRVLILVIHIAILSFTVTTEKIVGRPSTKKKA